MWAQVRPGSRSSVVGTFGAFLRCGFLQGVWRVAIAIDLTDQWSLTRPFGDMGATTGVRRQRADETRRRLFIAAMQLFSECGYVETSVDAIANLAGVAKGTFFVHYPTKDAVIAQLVHRQIDLALAERERVVNAGGGPIDAMRATVLSLGEQAARDRGLSRAVMTANVLSLSLGQNAETRFSEITTALADDARAAQRARLLRRSVDPETVAIALVTAYWGALLYFATSPRPRPLIEILLPALEANLRGFQVAPRRSLAAPTRHTRA